MTRTTAATMTTVESGQKNPKLVVFDLDYTLWPCWCDTHLTPPFKSGPNGINVIDKFGQEMQFYRDVPEILKHIHDSEHYDAVTASRTWAPDVAEDMLRRLHVDGKPAKSYIRTGAWGTGSKIAHFKELHKRTGVDYKDMVFFDDESRNRDVERKLGVTFVLVTEREGVSWPVFTRGLDMWRSNNS